MFVKPIFHHTTKVRNKTSYEAPRSIRPKHRGTFHTQF